MNKTSIEWTHRPETGGAAGGFTWNPIRARNKETGKVGTFYTHASPGCLYCYAEAIGKRFGTGLDFNAPNLEKVEFFIDEKILAEPLERKKPATIFVGDMFDLFHEAINPFLIGAVFGMMLKCQQHTLRENNQTYRLGWSEQCKDGSRMGVGMPEYLLLFRKPPTDRSKGYADEPVVKSKADYSRSRWQVDAHGFARSSGNRLLMPEDLKEVPHQRIFRLFRQFSREHVYDFEHHIKLSESLETCQECGHIHLKPTVCGHLVLSHYESGELPAGSAPVYVECECHGAGRLPVTFMLLQPQSWHPGSVV